MCRSFVIFSRPTLPRRRHQRRYHTEQPSFGDIFMHCSLSVARRTSAENDRQGQRINLLQQRHLHRRRRHWRRAETLCKRRCTSCRAHCPPRVTSSPPSVSVSCCCVQSNVVVTGSIHQRATKRCDARCVAGARADAAGRRASARTPRTAHRRRFRWCVRFVSFVCFVPYSLTIFVCAQLCEPSSLN